MVTGVSGSGKSTLAFDIVFAEGQRRYLESLNAYARQFVQPASRPDVDSVRGIPPTVAIEQRTSRGGRKSTVGTLTEIHHFPPLFSELAGSIAPLQGTDRAAISGESRATAARVGECASACLRRSFDRKASTPHWRNGPAARDYALGNR